MKSDREATIYAAAADEPQADIFLADAASCETRPAPHYTASGVWLYRADSLELLTSLPCDRVDLIFADPPYFLSNGGITCKSGRMAIVDKGEWDQSRGYAEDHEFNMKWLGECRRILKPDGTIWVTGTYHNIYSIGYALHALGYRILNDIAWYKVNPPPNLSCRYFTHATETVLWAARSKKSKHKFHYETMKRMNDGKQMQSMWQITPPTSREKRYGKHPTQKPEALLERIILASTDEGDLVLDPFCGSGTTGVVCARRHRRFVGIDNDAAHLEVAARRIADELRADGGGA